MSHLYSSTQVNLPEKLTNEIIKWGENNIPERNLFTEKDDFSTGREDESHVTIFYGLHTSKPEEVRKLLNGVGSFEITLGKISLFNWHSKFDVVKIDVFSEELHKLNKMLSRLPSTQIYPSYKPHITIAYVKKGSCENLINKSDFVGKKWSPKTIIFSSKDGTKTPIPLKIKSLQMR